MPAAPALPEVFGKYRIERRIGQGGMGTVWLARETELDRPVALKVPRLEGDSSEQVLARFRREARAAAGLRHPNICPVYEVGQVGDVPYLAMAFIEGRPLSAFVRPDRPMEPGTRDSHLSCRVVLALD